MNYLIFVLVLCSSHLFAKSETRLVYLTWKNDPTTTMTVQWLTSNKKPIDTLQYCPNDDTSKWQIASGTHTEVPQGHSYILHRVQLKNLTPDTTYQFKLGKSNTLYRFKTMPKDLSKPIRFVVGGDIYQHSVSKFEKMNKVAAKKNPRFAILGGDIAYTAPSKKKKSSEDFSKWRSFFKIWMRTMKDNNGCLIPILATIGNHEVRGDFNSSPKDAPFYYAFFERTSYDIQMGKYAYFVFLDSDHTLPIKGRQTDWLKKALKNHKKVTHRFATYHVGAYPSTGKTDGRVRRHVREHWVPLFEKYKVQACFESHDHAYKRTHSLINGKPHANGVVYFGDGSWGVTPRTPKKHSYIAHAKASQQVLVVELSSHHQRFQAIDPNGKTIDRYEQKIK